jgi:hypothetical protein
MHRANVLGTDRPEPLLPCLSAINWLCHPESYLRPLLGYPLIEKRCSAAEGCDLNVGPQPDGRKAILRPSGRLQSPSVSRRDVQAFPDSLLLLIAWVVSLLPALELNRQLSRFNLLTTAMSFAGTFVATVLFR